MKKLFTILMIVTLSVAFTLISPQQLQAKKKKIVSVDKNSFAQVAEHLDMGGDFYMYMSSEKLIKFVGEFLDVIKEIALNEAKKPAEAREIETGIDLVITLLNETGLFEISGVGMSSIKMKNGFNHDKTVIHHYKGMNKGLIWNLADAEPHAFDSQQLLPANTAFATFSDSKLEYLWQWIQKQAAEAGIPKLQQGVGMVGPMLKSKGIDLDALLGSLGGKSGIIMTLDESKMVKIPVKDMTIEFPDPALAIVIYVEDDSLFNLLQKFVPAPPLEEGGMKKIVGPVVPLPITLNPMVIRKDNLLIFASNGKIADAILARQNGLSKNPEFKNLSFNMPEKGNSYTFLSSKIFKTITGIQEKALEKAGTKEKKMYAAFKRLKILPKDLAFYTVKQNTAEGFIHTSNNNLPLGGSAILPAMLVGGVVAAIAVPNYLTAMNKGKQKATMGDMVTISHAVKAYIADKGHAPKAKTMVELKQELVPNYIKMLPCNDAWGHEFHYTAGMDGKAEAFCIGSGGKNGVFKGWQQSGFYTVTEVRHFDKDIIICNGAFTFGPKIKSKSKKK